MVKTEIGFTTVEKITVRNKDLANEILGNFDFVDMMMLTILNRLPEPREKRMINLLLVTACDHGLTPSAMSARLTYLGAPEALQGAVAAGLLGAGSVFLGTTQNSAEMLITAAKDLNRPTEDDLRECARALIKTCRQEKKLIYGVGHNIHTNGDPRVPRLIQISKDEGYFGKHWSLMLMIVEVLRDEYKKNLPMNAVGAIGAIIAEMNLDPLLARGFMLVGRSAGLLAHIYEERQYPVAAELWDLVLLQDPRNVLPAKAKSESSKI